jgi:hypothetical protein
MDLDYERRGHGGEQTGLLLGLACVRRIRLETHEYQGCVQIFVVSLDEVLVIFFSLRAVALVEFGTKILLDRLCVFAWAVRDFSINQKERQVRWYPSAGFPSSTTSLLPCSPAIQ